MILTVFEGFFVKEQLMEKYVFEIRHLGSTCQNIINQCVTEIRLHIDTKPV